MSDKLVANKSQLIKWGFTILATVILMLIPETGWYVGNVKTFFVITVCSLCIIAFEFFPTAVMVILMPALYALFEVAPLNVIMAPWTTNTMLITLGGMILAAELDSSGLLTRIAYYLMAKVDGSYTKLLIAVYFVGVVLSVLMFGTAYMIMAPLCAGLCAALMANKKKMGAGIALACMVGTCSSKTFVYPATMYAMLKGMAEAGGVADGLEQITVANAIIHNCPMFFVGLFIVWVVSKWYKPEAEANGKEFFNKKLQSLGNITSLEKKTAILLACIFIFMFTSPIHGIAQEYGFMIIPWLAFLPGINVGSEDTFKKMNWQMVFFTAGCMSIGMVASTIGLGDVIAEACAGIFSSGNVFIIFGTVFLLVFVLNFLMTPMAIWSLLMVPMMQVATTLGMSKLPFVYGLLTCAEAIVLPYEYVPYLFVYAFGMITMKDFVKLNALRCVLYIGGFMLVLIPYWMIIGLL